MKLQRLVDEKNEALYHLRAEGRSKTRYLKKTIQDLRRQFSGALTLHRQERFSETLQEMHIKKSELEKELNQVMIDLLFILILTYLGSKKTFTYSCVCHYFVLICSW